MKKLTIVLLITLAQHNQLTAMQLATVSRQTPTASFILDDITITFDTPPILLRIISHAATQYLQNPKDLSLIVAMSENTTSFGRHYISTTEEAHKLSELLGTLQLPRPIHIIVFNKKQFNNAPYALKKSAVFHEFGHVVQCLFDPNNPTPLEPTLYDNLEEDADVQTIIRLNCYFCAKEYAQTRPIDPTSPYLKKTKALQLIAALDRTLICNYHKALFKRYNRCTRMSERIAKAFVLTLEQKITTRKLEV